MSVTEEGISIEVRLLQYSKVFAFIFVTEGGMAIEVRLLQPWNARCPMFVTEAGISIEVSLLQPWYLQPVITQYFVSYKSEIWA